MLNFAAPKLAERQHLGGIVGQWVTFGGYACSSGRPNAPVPSIFYIILTSRQHVSRYTSQLALVAAVVVQSRRLGTPTSGQCLSSSYVY